MRVFLSYRRADDVFLAGRLRDRLAADFGDENVFFDVDSVPPGTDFREVIGERIDAADVVLALIGPRWDAPRLALTNDYVRMELDESLRQHKPLIPVLIADTAMPAPGELPEELATMAFLNALRIRPDPDFHRDSARLVEAVTDANDRELARVVEDEERVRVAGVEDASRQRQAVEAVLITSRDRAEAAENARVAAEAEVARLRARQETAEGATEVAVADADRLEAENKLAGLRDEALVARDAWASAEADANLLRAEEEAAALAAATAEHQQNVASTEGSEFKSPLDNVPLASSSGPQPPVSVGSSASDRLERARASPAPLERPPDEGTVGAGPVRGTGRRGRRRWIAAGVAVAFVAAAVTTITLTARRDSGDAAAIQLGAWVAQVTEANGDIIRTESGDLIAGEEPAWDVVEQRLAYVSTDRSGCGLCGVKSGSDSPVELVPAPTDGNVLHAPAWSKSGSLVYARTKGCPPADDCGDEIVLTRPGAPESTQQLVPSSGLRGVRDLEVDPQSTDKTDDILVAIVDARGAKLMGNGIVAPLSNGGDVAELSYSANSHIIAGLPEGRPRPEVEVWTRTGKSIDTVDLRQLLKAAVADGVDTGLDIATVEAISVSATGSSSDQKFAVALRDGSGEVGAVEIEVPYNNDPTAQLGETPHVSGAVSLPYTLYRGDEPKELVALREPDG